MIESSAHPLDAVGKTLTKFGQHPSETLHRKQPKHCKYRNSNLRRLQFLPGNSSLQGARRDAYDLSVERTR
jgi:hypothetical protein